MSARPMHTSEDTVWDVARRLPSRANLLLLEQPANSTAYTDRPAMAKKNSRPMFRSATPQVGVIGMIAKAISKALMATTGARVKITLSANGGVQSSLKNILIDRKSVVEGKSVVVRVDIGGRRIIKKKKKQKVTQIKAKNTKPTKIKMRNNYVKTKVHHDVSQ